jgi:hypothetical protein
MSLSLLITFLLPALTGPMAFLTVVATSVIAAYGALLLAGTTLASLAFPTAFVLDASACTGIRTRPVVSLHSSQPLFLCEEQAVIGFFRRRWLLAFLHSMQVANGLLDGQ